MKILCEQHTEESLLVTHKLRQLETTHADEFFSDLRRNALHSYICQMKISKGAWSRGGAILHNEVVDAPVAPGLVMADA